MSKSQNIFEVRDVRGVDIPLDNLYVSSRSPSEAARVFTTVIKKNFPSSVDSDVYFRVVNFSLGTSTFYVMQDGRKREISSEEFSDDYNDKHVEFDVELELNDDSSDGVRTRSKSRVLNKKKGKLPPTTPYIRTKQGRSDGDSVMRVIKLRSPEAEDSIFFTTQPGALRSIIAQHQGAMKLHGVQMSISGSDRIKFKWNELIDVDELSEIVDNYFLKKRFVKFGTRSYRIFAKYVV